FERTRDQIKYNALCTIGNDSDLALSTSTRNETVCYIEIVLNVAKKYDCEVVVELPQLKSEGLLVYNKIIEYTKQSSRANYARDKASIHQIENEIGLMVQKGKEIMLSHIIIVKNWALY
ncbi:31604_t:CDS:2, partial [Gigaspora margarita]